MHIKTFRIQNYKSFDDSGVHALARGFNVIVGQNNVGKTALVEALSLKCSPSPHRSIRQPMGAALSPISRADITFVVSGDEAKEILLAARQFSFPIRPDWRNQAVGMLGELLARPEIEVGYAFSPSGGIPPFRYPSHALFGSPPDMIFTTITADLQNRTFAESGYIGGSADDFGPQLAGRLVAQIYCFRAERFSLGTASYGEQTVLRPDGGNLAEVLGSLQGRNPERFRIINEHVRAIFPTIHQITVRPFGGRWEIIVWSVDPASQREDLAMPLDQSGTGIGQVLAILYVIVTSNSPRTIIVDEPNTFLHPGALRKLLSIMQSAPLPHQYVVTTHSLQVIAVADPQTLYLVRWEDGRSQIEPLEIANLNDLRHTLLEVGARLSDVFGADAVLWVEGPTEQECFSKILKKYRVVLPLGTAVVAVRQTGDLEMRRPSAKVICGIYERLSTADALMPRTLAFTLDREGRPAAEMLELQRRYRDLVHFIPRRMFENYLLDADAIATILGTAERPITSDAVSDWIAANGNNPKYIERHNPPLETGSVEWLAKVHGGKLLGDLFFDLATQEYRKMVHSTALADWILTNRERGFEELAEFLRPIVALGQRTPL